MVVQWRHFKDAAAFAILLFGILKVTHLQHYRKVLDQENAAKNWYKQLLTNYKCQNRNDTPIDKLPVSPIKT